MAIFTGKSVHLQDLVISTPIYLEKKKRHCIKPLLTLCSVSQVPTFVVVLGVMTRMGPWGKVLITVRDQRGERVDRMGRLHNGDFVGLRREMQESFNMT